MKGNIFPVVPSIWPNDSWLLNADTYREERNEKVSTHFFSYYQKVEFLCTVKYNLDTGEETWLAPVIVPEKWQEISTFMSPDESTFIDGNVYFAMGYHLYVYEIENGTIVEKPEITDTVEKLFSEFAVSDFAMGFQSIGLYDYASPDGTIIIAFYPTLYKSAEEPHLIYFLIWNDTFAGALDINGDILHLYDNEGQLTRECDIADLNLENIALRFPKSQSRH